MAGKLLTYYGTPGAFGTLPESIGQIAVDDFFPAGICLGRITVDPDSGQVILGLASQRGNGVPTADQCLIGAFDPVSRTVSLDVVPTTTGATTVVATTFDGSCTPTVHCYGASGAGDVATWVSPDGRRFMFLNFTPDPVWQIGGPSGLGNYPLLPIGKLVDGRIVFDPTLSTTVDELAVGVGAGAFEAAHNSACFGAEPYGFAKGPSEMATFPNGHQVYGQYYRGGGLVCVDKGETGKPKITAVFDFPDFYHPSGALPPSTAAQAIGYAVRTVQTDPTSTDPTDLRFFVGADIFAPAARTITRLSCSAHKVTYTTSVPHGYGVGMYVKTSGLTGADASFNDPSFSQPREVIVAVTATTFTRHSDAADVADHAVAGAGSVETSTGAALIEMSYDSVAGTIVPKSQPIYDGPDKRTISTVAVDSYGHLWVNRRTTGFGAWGAIGVYLKDPATGERSLVTAAPATPTWDVDGWDTVVEPDHRYAMDVGTSITVGMATDPRNGRLVFAAQKLQWIDAQGFLPPVNVLTDPSFESVDPATVWTGFFSSIHWDSAVVRTGVKSMRIDKTGAGTGQAPATHNVKFPVVASQSWELEAWMQAQDPGVSGRLGLVFYNAAGTQVGVASPNVQGQTFQIAVGSWTRVRAAILVPDGATQAAVQVSTFDVTGAAHHVWVEDLDVHPSPGTTSVPFDLGLSHIPVGGDSLNIIQGEVDPLRGIYWYPVSQTRPDQPCPPEVLPQFLGRIDLALLYDEPFSGTGATADDLLNLRGIRQRMDCYRFDLLDSTNKVVGTVQPSKVSVPQIVNDTTRQVFRTLSGFFVDATRQASIDTAGARVRPMLVLQTGDEYPLGVFLFGDATRPRRSWGLELAATLTDQLYILNQPVGRVVGYPEGTNIIGAAAALAAEVITSPTSVAPSSQVLGAPLAWPLTDSRTKIMNKLLELAGYLPVYFDNSGTMILRPVPVLPASTPGFTYEAGGRILKDSIVEADDLLTAPNRYVVVDSGTTKSPIVATYDLPASAPNSIANRGFPVVKPLQLQGLGTAENAARVARAAADSDHESFKQRYFESTHEPRHDTFEVVQFLGDQHREIKWTAQLRSGGRMGHDLRQVYA